YYLSSTHFPSSCSIAFTFFLYSYGPPRDLHSFPTRRSSDLSRASARSPCSSARVSLAWVQSRRAWRRSTARARPPSSASTEAARDRKSTRLNSSHVSISYAVFCLKKKKNTRNAHETNNPHAS